MLVTGSFKVKSGYLTAFLLLLMSYFLIFYTLQQLLKQSSWIENTDRVIINLETLLSQMNEVESAARGYVLMNDPEHLEIFYAGTKRVDSLLKNVEHFVEGDIIQERKTDTLKMLIQEKLGKMYRGVLSYKQAGYILTDEMRSSAATAKKLMNNIKIVIDDMENHENLFLAEKKEKLRAVSVSIKIITITSLIIALLLSAYSFITYSRESQAKSKADNQAKSYWNELEKKVKELQEANTELIELRSMEKFVATGRIARTIAHEIRNPLTNIGLASEQVKSASDQNEETIMLVEMINRNANRINQMISDLLTSTKFAQLQYTRISANDLVEQTIEFANDRIELKHVKVKKQYTSENCDILVDVQKMKIAILNVIVNAIEAMENEDGILEIRTNRVDDKCIIDIIDNGIGMNEETLQKLFEPYFTNKSKGAGLGLTTTQNIILNHKGSMNVISTLGEGTTFSIILNADVSELRVIRPDKPE